MSGMVGIVNFDGAPIDRSLLSRMTASLDFRGPDARRIWISEPTHESCSAPRAGFGHTLLRTTYEAEHEQQPFTLDGVTWIVADSRVDAREELLAKLRAKGRDASLHRPDVELILHAWHVWGEQCVEHLLGDFAFAIWDAPLRRLFCARDHMGVKPFYYAHIGSIFIFSNTLDCVRMHPAVSDKLNDLAIADFLLFELNQVKDTTSFADVQRIAPAHVGIWTRTEFRSRCYWTLPIDEPFYFKRLADYTDRFSELQRQSVKDRLRTDKVGVFMSGGLDSPTLAATACELLHHDPDHEVVKAFTTIFGEHDEEQYYAGIVARHLRIPIHFQSGDCFSGSAPEAERSETVTSEPYLNPLLIQTCHRHYQNSALYSRIALHGEGPDNALEYEWKAHISNLVRRRRYGRLAYDCLTHIAAHRRIPLLPTIPRMMWESHRARFCESAFPEWLNDDFDRRLALRERWEEKQSERGSEHPTRPEGYYSLGIPRWQVMFESIDPGFTRVCLEFRHPFSDIRLLRYMLGVPGMPWCRAKYLLRQATRGILPDEIRRRKKSPLVMDPWRSRLIASCASPHERASQLGVYVAREKIPDLSRSTISRFWTDLRPHSLNHWLCQRAGVAV